MTEQNNVFLTVSEAAMLLRLRPLRGFSRKVTR